MLHSCYLLHSSLGNLQSTDTDLVRESLGLLCERRDPIAADRAVQLLTSPDDYVWLNSAEYLGAIGRAEAVPYLIKAFRHTAALRNQSPIGVAAAVGAELPGRFSYVEQLVGDHSPGRHIGLRQSPWAYTTEMSVTRIEPSKAASGNGATALLFQIGWPGRLAGQAASVAHLPMMKITYLLIALSLLAGCATKPRFDEEAVRPPQAPRPGSRLQVGDGAGMHILVGTNQIFIEAALDSEGWVDLPKVGKFYRLGMSTSEADSVLSKACREQGINPVGTAKL